MVKDTKPRNSLVRILSLFFLFSFSQSLIVFAEGEETAPVVEETAPVVEETAPEVEEIIESDDDLSLDEVLKDILDETFTNPEDNALELDEITESEPVDFEKIFEDTPSQIPNSITIEDIEKFDDVFSNVDLSLHKDESINGAPQIDPARIAKEEKYEAEPLHACAFDNFSIEIFANQTKTIPILLKKSGPNKKFALDVGKVPSGIEIKFSSSNDHFTAVERGQSAMSQKLNDLKNKTVNKELIFKDSVLKEKTPEFKKKEKEEKLNTREIIIDEVTVISSNDVQIGSFNIPILYSESDQQLEESNFKSDLATTTNCQFNLIVK